jgi:Fe-S-cluster containining protein
MKQVESPTARNPIGQGGFRFDCHPGVACFTRCCRDVDTYLYPYDIVRIKGQLGITSDEFLDKYTLSAFRDNPFFPNVMLRMADQSDKPCPFLSQDGCTIYEDRPSSCREYPLERAVARMPVHGERVAHYFVKRVPHCLGHEQEREWTAKEWITDQAIGPYIEMNDLWMDMDTIFRSNPWGHGEPGVKKLKMAFMACFNVDQFRHFMLNSSFQSRFDVPKERMEIMTTDDVEMTRFGFEWVAFFLTGRGPLASRTHVPD